MRALLVAWCLCALACGRKNDAAAEAPVGISSSERAAPIQFAFDSVDERPVSSAASKGRITVIGFITTWDITSQAQADFLSAMARTDGGEIAYFLVMLDDEKNRELVETYAKALDLQCPLALADRDTVAGRSGFGELVVPTVVVLDRASRMAWRKTGLAKSEELRQVIDSVERAADLAK